MVLSGVESFFLYADSLLWSTWWTGLKSFLTTHGWVSIFFRAAQECGEFSATSAWTTEIFTAPNMMFGQEVRTMDWIRVTNFNLGEVTRPGGDGPHQGQASVQRASSNHRFCQGDLLDLNSFWSIVSSDWHSNCGSGGHRLQPESYHLPCAWQWW